jgi:hypothetical protein
VSGRYTRLKPIQAASGIAMLFLVVGSTYTCVKSTTAAASRFLAPCVSSLSRTNIPMRYVTEDFPSFDTVSPKSNVSAARLTFLFLIVESTEGNGLKVISNGAHCQSDRILLGQGIEFALLN